MGSLEECNCIFLVMRYFEILQIGLSTIIAELGGPDIATRADLGVLIFVVVLQAFVPSHGKVSASS